MNSHATSPINTTVSNTAPTTSLALGPKPRLLLHLTARHDPGDPPVTTAPAVSNPTRLWQDPVATRATGSRPVINHPLTW